MNHRLHARFPVDPARGNDRHVDGLDDTPRQFGWIALAGNAIRTQVQPVPIGNRCDAARVLDDFVHRSLKHDRMPDSAAREREIPHLRAAQKQQGVFDVAASEQIVDADLNRGPDRSQLGLAARRHDLEHDLAVRRRECAEQAASAPRSAGQCP